MRIQGEWRRAAAVLVDLFLAAIIPVFRQTRSLREPR